MTALVFPGDDVTSAISALSSSGEVALGSGLLAHASTVRATRLGALKLSAGTGRAPARAWVASPQGAARYEARVGDDVVGVVDERGVEGYRLQLYGHLPARLPSDAFEGATKRSKPNLQVGAVVFARVARVTPGTEPELTCEEAPSKTSKKSWLTGQATYGELSHHTGAIVRCAPGFARALLDPGCVVLRALATHMSFEIAVGVNGAVWVRAAGPLGQTTVAACCLREAEGMQCGGGKRGAEADMVRRLVRTAQEGADGDDDDDAMVVDGGGGDGGGR